MFGSKKGAKSWFFKEIFAKFVIPIPNGMKTYYKICVMICFAQAAFFTNAVAQNVDVGDFVYSLAPPQSVQVGFNAIINDKKVDLTWTTDNEKRIDYFAVERSMDGLEFEIFAMTKGSGNSSMPIEYHEVDYSPFSGISYYRIKQTNQDGQVSYTPIVAVNYHFDGPHGINVSPNPNDGEFSIDVTGAINEEVLVVVRDISGKEVFSKLTLKKEGKNLVVINSENKLSAGVYLVMASSRNELYSQKIIVR